MEFIFGIYCSHPQPGNASLFRALRESKQDGSPIKVTHCMFILGSLNHLHPIWVFASWKRSSFKLSCPGGNVCFVNVSCGFLLFRFHDSGTTAIKTDGLPIQMWHADLIRAYTSLALYPSCANLVKFCAITLSCIDCPGWYRGVLLTNSFYVTASPKWEEG